MQEIKINLQKYRLRFIIQEKIRYRRKVMSYVDEVIELVEKKNPGEPEFHQAVKGK